MKLRSLGSLMILGAAALAAQSPLQREIPVVNWPSPRQVLRSQLPAARSAAVPKLQLPGGVASDALVFVPVAPCRLADTRSGSGYPALGSTPLSSLTPRNLTVAAACGIPDASHAEAYSFNVTVVPATSTPGGYMVVYPNPASPVPLTASLTWNPGASYQTAAVVVAGSSNGSVNFAANFSTDVVVDVNGYYGVPTDANANTGEGQGSLATLTGGETGGVDNTAFGKFALEQTTTGSNNTGVGYVALQANTVGPWNTAVGSFALASNQGSGANTAVGYQALESANPSGGVFQDGAGANTAVGFRALQSALGSNNIAVGSQAGIFLTSGSGSILIGNQGNSTDTAVIRIGDATQTSTYIAGIYGRVASGGQAVYVNSGGQLGTSTILIGGLRDRENARNVGDASAGLMRLRTVAYREPDPAAGRLRYGLFADEVANALPDLVLRGPDGAIEGMRESELPVLLLNELQKVYRHSAEQDESLRREQERNRKLEDRLAALEDRLARMAPDATVDTATNKVGPRPAIGR